MTFPFLKMHGLGNDFVVLDARRQPVHLTADQVRAIADRRTGVGCDQLIVVEPAHSGAGHVFMRIYNADGSEVAACGNATRCVAALVLGESGRERALIETAAGLLDAGAMPDGRITVDMGPPRLAWHEIPLARAMDTLSLDLTYGALSAPCAVSMGNPHCVFFVEDAETVPLAEIGPVLEHHPLFPERTNVEAAQVLAPDRIRLRVWERGAGITRACGTGACATLVAAARRGLTGRAAEVVLDGGALHVAWREADGHVLMTGPVAVSFTGTLSETLLHGSLAA